MEFVEFKDSDFPIAKEIARKLGYGAGDIAPDISRVTGRGFVA